MLFHVDVCTFMLPLLSHTNPVISQNCPHTEPCCPIMFPCCPQPCPYTSATKTLLILVLLPHCPVLFPMVSHAAVSCAVPTLTYNVSCTLLFHAVLTSSLILSFCHTPLSHHSPYSVSTLSAHCPMLYPQPGPMLSKTLFHTIPTLYPRHTPPSIPSGPHAVLQTPTWFERNSSSGYSPTCIEGTSGEIVLGLPTG